MESVTRLYDYKKYYKFDKSYFYNINETNKLLNFLIDN